MVFTANKADGSVIIDTKLDTAGFSKGTAQIKGQFNTLGASVKKIGGILAAAFSVRALVNFSKQALELGSDLQEVQNVVNVTFTSMRENVNSFAQSAAKTAGLSETMAKRYIGTFGAMSKSFGFSEQEAYNMSTALTQLTGDIASFYNLSQDAAYTKLKSVFTGETESLKDLGVVMTQTALDEFAMRKGIGKTTQKMSEQEKVALRYQFILEQLNGASGDFIRTQDGWANQTRVLSLQFEQLKATIGQGLINVLTPVLRLINMLIGKIQEFAVAFKSITSAIFGDASDSGAGGMAESLGAAADNAAQLEENIESAGKEAKRSLAGFDEINALAESSGGAVDTSGSAATGGISSVSIPIETEIKDNVTPKIETMISTVKNLFSGLVNEFKTLFSPAVSSWGAAFSSLVPSITAAVDRIKTAFSDLWNNSLAPTLSYIVSDFIPSIANSYSETFAPIFADIMPVAIDLWTTDFENSTLLISKYCGWLQEYFGKVKLVFTDMCKSISSNWNEYGGSLLQGFTDFKNGLWETFWYIYDNIIDPVFSYISQTFDSLWTKHLSPLWDSIVDFVMSVSDNIMLLWNKTLKPIVDWIGIKLMPFITAIWVGVVDAVNIIVSWVSDAVRSVINYLKGMIDFVVGIFTLDFEKAWNGIKEMFSAVWLSIENTFTGVINAIIWAINQLVAAIYSGIASTVNGLGSIVSGVGKLLGKEDWGFSMPNIPPKIPYLAQGAVIPPNAPFMAVLGDQKNGTNIEAPLSTIQEAVAMVMQDQTAAIMAGFASSVEVQREILQAVLGIQIGDDVIAAAYDRYRTKLAVQRGG